MGLLLPSPLKGKCLLWGEVRGAALWGPLKAGLGERGLLVAYVDSAIHPTFFEAKLGTSICDKQCKLRKLGWMCLQLLFGIEDVQPMLCTHGTD